MASYSSLQMASLGEQLRQLREASGQPARIPAHAADIDSTQLCKIESGKRPVTAAQLVALAKFYRVDLAPLEARRVAEDMKRRYGSHPQFAAATAIVSEEAGEYRVKKQPAKVNNPGAPVNKRRKSP